MSRGTDRRTVRVAPELWKAALATAEQRGEKVPDIIRQALEAYTYMHSTGWSAPIDQSRIQTGPGWPRRSKYAQKPGEPHIGIPTEIRADRDALPDGFDDTEPRHWCNHCGLADAPTAAGARADTPTCPRCGSTWRWFGRLSDADGSAVSPPPGECVECFEWRKFDPWQEHFGWSWWLICGHCDHTHHAGEVWIA